MLWKEPMCYEKIPMYCAMWRARDTRYTALFTIYRALSTICKALCFHNL